MSNLRVLDIPLISVCECEEINPFVDELRGHWLPYGSDPKFPYYHVVPTAMYYRTARREASVYQRELKITNHFLMTRLEPTYSKILGALADYLNEPVRLTDEVAYPGFHLYQLPMPNPGKIHVDDQHSQYSWRNQSEWDFKRAFSLTLVIMLPESGSRLNTWDHDFPLRNLSSFGAPDLITEYAIGHLYVFSSYRFHQVGASPMMKAGERRLTLQSHALYNRNGFWSLYW